VAKRGTEANGDANFWAVNSCQCRQCSIDIDLDDSNGGSAVEVGGG